MSQPYQIIRVCCEGNCLYRAVSYFMYGDMNQFRQIRGTMIETIVSNWEFYSNFIVGNLSYSANLQTPDDYVELITEGDWHGGECELNAISSIFNIHILVWYTNMALVYWYIMKTSTPRLVWVLGLETIYWGSDIPQIEKEVTMK